jgi:hypothetical protein
MATFSATRAPIQIAGAASVEEGPDGAQPQRLPESCGHILDMMTQFQQRTPSGVRIVFRTDSPFIGLTMLPTTMHVPELRPEPRSAAVDLVIGGEVVQTQIAPGGRLLVIDLKDLANMKLIDGAPVSVRFDDLGGGEKDVELWLPPSGPAPVSAIELADGASLAAVHDTRRRWVHYGSSISQCSDATSPARVWPGVAARLADLHLISLGLGGSCHVDPYVAQYIRDLEVDVVTLKLGINVVNLASFRERTFVPAVHGFLDTVREGHPETPIVVASPIFCPSAEDCPGPSAIRSDGKFYATGNPVDIARGALTLRRIRSILEEAVSVRRTRGDPNLHYLDGLELFGEADAPDLPDDLHPNGPGYERMGQRFYERVFAPAGLLG